MSVPDGQLYTIEALAIMFGRTRKAMHRLVERFGTELDPPVYGQFRPALRLYRLLTERDVRVLSGRVCRALRVNVVKKKVPPRNAPQTAFPRVNR